MAIERTDEIEKRKGRGVETRAAGQTIPTKRIPGPGIANQLSPSFHLSQNLLTRGAAECAGVCAVGVWAMVAHAL